MCIIVGDMNIDLNTISNSATQINELIAGHDFKQMVDFNTRITNESETLIDYVITNRADRLKCNPLNRERISDHETIEILISKVGGEDIGNKQVLSWSNYDKELLITNLRNCSWHDFDIMDINSKVSILNRNMESAAMPMVNYVAINSGERPKKWYDEELKDLKLQKITKYNRWAETRCDYNWSEYINIRNIYNKIIKLKKNKYTQKQIVTAGKNQKKIWKCLNSLISDKSYKSCEEVVFDDGRCSDPVMLCEKFNSFFVDSIILLNRNIPHHDYMSQLTRYNEENVRLKFRPTNIEEVTKTLRFLSKKINKSEICNSMVWLDSAEYCGYFLTRIINDSMQTGYFPTLWKIATVVPIPKIKNSNKAADYRGINILPIDEKVCEIIVKNQLVEFVESNRILSQHQSAQHQLELNILANQQ